MAQQKSYITAKDDKEASQLAEKIQRDYKTSRDLTDEKIMLADKAMELLQRHIKKLDETLAEAIKNVDESALPTSLFEGITPSTDKSKCLLCVLPS